MDDFDDSSSIYETTYSQDERIEEELRKQREFEKNLEIQKDMSRKRLFEQYLNDKNLEIFHLPGLEVIKLTHLKIKFSFEPRIIVKYVNNKVKFYCTLRYNGKYWNIKRNLLPVNYKPRIYKMFYVGMDFTVDDENVFEKVFQIYQKLLVWAKGEDEYRLKKYERYVNKEDVELDSCDEELFLDEAQRVELQQKRLKILRRMLPPKETRRRNKKKQ